MEIRKSGKQSGLWTNPIFRRWTSGSSIKSQCIILTPPSFQAVVHVTPSRVQFMGQFDLESTEPVLRAPFTVRRSCSVPSFPPKQNFWTGSPELIDSEDMIAFLPAIRISRRAARRVLYTACPSPVPHRLPDTRVSCCVCAAQRSGEVLVWWPTASTLPQAQLTKIRALPRDHKPEEPQWR